MIYLIVDDIYKVLEGKFLNMSVVIVYNNLRVFCEVGIVKELIYGDVLSWFDYVIIEYYYVICESCGKIVDFYYFGLDEVEKLVVYIIDFDISYYWMEIYGMCFDCMVKKVY